MIFFFVVLPNCVLEIELNQPFYDNPWKLDEIQ